MSTSTFFTRKQLVQATGAMPYQISYLTSIGRLPLIRTADGPGYPNLYHPDAVAILHNYLKKNQPGGTNESQ